MLLPFYDEEENDDEEELNLSMTAVIVHVGDDSFWLRHQVADLLAASSK